MAISLVKGGNLSLGGAEPGLKRILIGLGWDARATDGLDFDLDASAFLLSAAGKVPSDNDFIFYNNLVGGGGAVEHTGDNRTGDGDGDDESIRVTLDQVPAAIRTIAVTVTIHDAGARRQNFGQVRNAFIRIVNDDTGSEIVRYDLSEDYSTETALIFGELYRHGSDWKFRAVGQGYAGGLAALCARFGLDVA